MDLFEKMAEACGWTHIHWPVLSREAQETAQQLPVENLLACYDLKQAIIQWVDRSHEQHRQRFRSVELGYGRWTFVMSQQLWDACYKWLMIQTHDVEEVIT